MRRNVPTNMPKYAVCVLFRSWTWCLALILTLGIICQAYGAGGDIIWQASDAQAGKQEAKASAIDSRGNVIITGYQNLSGGTNDDFYTVKFKPDGSGVAWRASFDKGGGSDQAMAIAVDTNDDVIVTGFVWNGSNRDIHTIKYSGDTGAVIWQHTYDGAAHGNDIGTSIAVDSLNNVYVGGDTQNSDGNDDYLVLKYSPAGGTPLWQATYNGTGNGIDQATSIAAGIDGIAVTGQSWNGTAFDMLTVKYDFSGTKLWEKRYTTGAGGCSGKVTRMDMAGNVVVTGSVANGIDLDIYTVKYSGATGEVIWSRTYNGAYDDEPNGMILDPSGDIYITGYTWTLAGTNDFYTARYNGSTGTLVWDAVFDSGNGNTDIAIATGIGVDPSGDVFVTGYTVAAGNYDFQTIKYKKDNGNQLWHQGFNGAANGNDRPVGIWVASSGDVLVTGWSDDGVNDQDYYVIKYDPGALNPPTNLAATPLSNTSIQLSWADNSDNEDGFKIERKLGEYGTYSQIAVVGPNTTGYTDTGLAANNYYYYRVRSYSAAIGDSHYSNEAHALTVVVNFLPPAWTYLFNSPDNMDDFAAAIAVGPDNNPVVTGYSLRAIGGFDYFTAKLNRADSSIAWSDLYDDPDSEMDEAKCLAVDSSNNAVVSGFSSLYYAPATKNINSIYTIKYPAAGPPATWHAQYNGPGAIDDRAVAIATTTDTANNVVVLGYGKNAANNDDIYVVKYNADGTKAWSITPFDGGGDDIPSAVAVAPDGSVYVTGYSEKAPNTNIYNFLTVKYNGATGALVWSDVYSVTAGGDNQGRALAIDGNGDLYVTGFANNAGGDKDIYTIKYSGSSTSATRLWEHSLDGAAHGDDDGIGVQVDPIDGSVVVAGTTLTNPGDHDITLVRYTQTGDVIWQKTLQRPASDDHATAMTIDSSGYIYIAGNTGNGDTTDIISLIYDFEGTFLGATVYNGAANGNDEASSIAVNYLGEAFIAGYSTNASGNADYAVVKQTNNYILVPAPFIPTPQADYSKINLAWGDNTAGVGFRIERTLGPVSAGSVWTLIDTAAPGTTGYQDSGLNLGTNYCYRIEAYNGTLNSRKIVTCATTTLSAPVMNPIVIVSPTAIDISWTNVPGNTGYKLERSTNNSTWSQVGGNLAANTVFYHDTGLAAGTTYYYRVSTISAAGVSLPSGVQIAPVLNSPSGVTSANVTLSWPAISGITGYTLERSTDNATWAQLATPVATAVSYSDTAVAPATIYYYRLKAMTGAGESVPSLAQTATTILSSPTLNSATAASTSQITLSWTDVTGENGFTIWEQSCNYNGNNYDVTYCQSGYTWAWGGWTQVATTGNGVTTYSRSGLPAGYAYQYYIVATSGGIVSPASNVRLAWSIPAAPTLNVPSAPSDTNVNLSWNNVGGETGYTVERKTDAGGTYAAIATLGQNATSYTDTTVVAQTTYYYRLKANGVTTSSAYSIEQSITTPPTGPVVTSVTATAVPPSTITVNWGAVAGATSYDVQRSTFTYYDRPDLAGNASYATYWSAWTTAGTSDTNGYTDTNVTAGYIYKYSVRANLSGNYTGWGVDGGKYASTIPPTPTGLAANGYSTTQMNLTWSNIYGETNYGVQYKVRSGADCATEDWSTGVLTTPAINMNATTYSVTGLNTANAYCFQIKSYNSSGSSAWSAAVTCLPPPNFNPPSGITQSSITVSWNTVTGNTGYRVERSTDGSNYTLIYTAVANASSYTDNGLTAGQIYYYRVRTLYGSNQSAPSNMQNATTQTVLPPTLDAPSGITISQITLTWGSVTENAGYKLERSPDNANWTVIASPSTGATSYTDTGLTSGTLYYYRISTKNSQGSFSLPSNMQSAVTLLPSPSVSLTGVTEARIDLTWQLVFGATNYKVFRSIGPDGPWTQVNNVAVAYTALYCGYYSSPTIGCPTLVPAYTSYSDTGLAENAQYCYQLKAWSSGAGDSLPSATVCLKTPAVGGPNLTAVTPIGSSKIRLDWTYDPTACSPNSCDTPDGFEIWRKLVNGEWALVTTVPNIFSYTDTTALDPLKTYTYRVRAYKGTDESSFSNTVGVSTPAFATSDGTCP